MDIDPDCYTFKRLEVEAGIFDTSVDATYVITLEGNGRYERIHTQLTKYHPTRLVYILTNRGYSRCNKNLEKNIPRYDLTDAFITVFKHAKQQDFSNILVLEDDFIFSDSILEPKTITEVSNFISARTNTDFIYLLGCLPFLQLPYDENNTIPFLSAGMHAVVYSRASREKTLHYYTTETIDDWDMYHNMTLQRYTYYKPLVYQTFPVTENRKQWAAPDFAIFIAGLFISLLRLDVNVEPGYTILYNFSKALFYILLCIPFLAAYFIFRPRFSRRGLMLMFFLPVVPP